MIDPRVVSSLICVIVGGSLVGYSTGYVSVALAWYNVVSNCTGVSTQQACEWVGSSGAGGCVWVNATTEGEPHCAFSTGGACATTTDEATCKGDARCSWDPNVNTCSHVASWNANEQGWIATTMIIGGLIGSMLGEPCVKRLGLRRSMVMTGILAVISTACILVGWALSATVKRFALLLAFRTLNGVAVGFASIFCPMYVGDVAPKAISVKIGVCFQVFLTFGIMLAAGLGWAMQPTAPTDYADVLRFQVLNAVNMVISVAMIPMGALVMKPTNESANRAGHNDDGLYSLIGGDDVGADGASSTRFWFTKMMWGGVMLSVVQQLCGINAIMNYVPNMATTVGVSNPFLSNFVVMIWNFITSLVAIPIAERTAPETSYIVGTVVASIACFITGVPTYPGVADAESTRNGLVIFGILLFIFAFEVGMGPPFYVLAQSMFPERVRAKGCSFTMAIQFLFNIGVNYGFPVLVEAFSGGANGDQKKGLAIMFFLFGAVSIVSIVVFKLLGVRHQPVDPPSKFELDA